MASISPPGPTISIEMAAAVREMVFFKGLNTVQAHAPPIVLPTAMKSDEVDYECELAVVIGKACKNVAREDALDYVLGYTCANDVSARDWQIARGGSQWCRGKMFDTFCPLGPAIETELDPLERLAVIAKVNDEVRQAGFTSDMVFGVAEILEYITAFTTLLPGDVILTGTPSGVGPVEPGDVMEIEVDGIGSLVNRVAAP